MSNKITAKCSFQGRELSDVPVLNAGGWFGRTWLLEISGAYWPLFLIVEADNVSDAIDELADDESYGHHIVVPEENLGDYDPETCHYGPSGQVIDLDHLMIHGNESSQTPFPCRYFGDDLPAEGMTTADFCDWDD